MSQTKSPLDEAFQRELQRRLMEIDACAGSKAGDLNYMDWLIIVIFFLVVPLVFVWLYRS
jgi:hypothetical protein